ncbi:hypothetical protein Q8F55_004546 [Vanrija albida]|uniref:LYC1 C-terminal domain-containing protein n=1 Tax=Vanrija albida TaxID=181172 RepID=A0ABR3Q785_9TREE
MTKPRPDYTALTIRIASPAQKVQSHRNQYPEWGQPRGFSVDEFLHRETVLNGDERPWVRDGGFTTWVLVPRAEPETLNLLASCETYKRDSLYLPPGESTPRPTTAYGIASVFCIPEHRGNRYPTFLLQLLHYVMAEEGTLPPFPAAWGQPPQIEGFKDARFSVLYSGVGRVFYSKVRKGDGEGSEPGWVADEHSHRIWDIKDVPAPQVDGLEYLGADEVAKLAPGVGEYFKSAIASTGDKSKTRLAILPTRDMFGVHPLRYELAPGHRKTATFGVRLPAPEKGAPQPFFTYSYEISTKRPERLVLLYVQHPVPFEAVLAAAKHEGVASIEMWGGFAGWDKEAGGATLDREDSVCALAQYGFGGDDKVEWEWVEKYAWC